MQIIFLVGRNIKKVHGSVELTIHICPSDLFRTVVSLEIMCECMVVGRQLGLLWVSAARAVPRGPQNMRGLTA